MKLIIDIPYSTVKDILTGKDVSNTSLYKAVENGIPLDAITDEIYREKEAIHFDLNEAKARWTNSGIYDGLEWALEIIDKHVKAEGCVEVSNHELVQEELSQAKAFGAEGEEG